MSTPTAIFAGLALIAAAIVAAVHAMQSALYEGVA